MRSRSLRRKFFAMMASTLVLAISIAASLAIGEVLVRVFYPVYSPRGMIVYKVAEDGTPLIHEKNTVLRQWKEAGDYDVAVYSNELGLRNRKHLAAVGKNAWYVVGDSFSFGHGVEESQRFSDVLENQALVGEVVNISIPTDFDGYDRLLSYVIRNGAEIHHLIIGVCMENDLRLYGEAAGSTAAASQSNKVKVSELVVSLKVALAESSALYNLFTSAVHHNRTLKKWAVDAGLIYPNRPGSPLPSRDEMQSSMRRLIALREKYKVDPVVLIVPSRWLWLGDDQEQAAAEHDYFVRLLKENAFRVVDVRDAFEDSGNPLDYHFANDGHWNSGGHRVAAELLQQYILDQKMQQLGIDPFETQIADKSDSPAEH